MNILVTGGTGYIGSHTCVALLEAGHTVFVADNLSNSKIETLEQIKKLPEEKQSFIKWMLQMKPRWNPFFPVM